MQNADDNELESLLRDPPTWLLAFVACLVAEYFRHNTWHKLRKAYNSWIDGNSNSSSSRRRPFCRREPSFSSQDALDIGDCLWLILVVVVFALFPEKAIVSKTIIFLFIQPLLNNRFIIISSAYCTPSCGFASASYNW